LAIDPPKLFSGVLSPEFDNLADGPENLTILHLIYGKINVETVPAKQRICGAAVPEGRDPDELPGACRTPSNFPQTMLRYQPLDLLQ
jgi:hypothetical protein